MRRPLGLVLVGLGAFLLALAPLTRFYVSDEVSVAPLNYYQETALEAQNATYFDLATRKVREGATLAVANTVRGDTRANRGGKNIAVWDSISEIYDKERKKQVEFQSYRIAFDRRSSQLTNCCGTHVGGDTSVRFAGYGLLFPIANVEKRDYPVFDMSTRRPLPMKYEGEERVQGLNTYRFVQDVPKFKTAKVDYKLSGKMLGTGKKNDLYRVDRYFSATISVWVDPRTGIPVKHRQNIKSTVETPNGKGSMAVAEADLITIERDQKRNVTRSDDYASKLYLVKTGVPVGALIAGLIFLLLGSGLSLFGNGARGARPRPGAPGGTSGGTSREAIPRPEGPNRPNPRQPEPVSVVPGMGGPPMPPPPGPPPPGPPPQAPRHARRP